MKLDGDNLLRLFSRITEDYKASLDRGITPEYQEGAQIGRLGLSLELCPYAEGSPACMDWRRGYFMELGKR